MLADTRPEEVLPLSLTPLQRTGPPTPPIVLTKTITLVMARTKRKFLPSMIARFFNPWGREEDGDIFPIPVSRTVRGQTDRTRGKNTQRW